MSETRPVLQVEALSKTFDAIEAVHDLSFSLDRGEIFGLLGASAWPRCSSSSR